MLSAPNVEKKEIVVFGNGVTKFLKDLIWILTATNKYDIMRLQIKERVIGCNRKTLPFVHADGMAKPG